MKACGDLDSHKAGLPGEMSDSKRVQDAQQLKKIHRLEKVLENKSKFETELAAVTTNVSNPSSKDVVDVSQRDVLVCARIRPMLADETSAGFFPTVGKNTTQSLVHALDVRTDVRTSSVKPNPQEFKLDLVFGPNDDNQAVFDACAADVVDLGLKGGIATLFAYGQTGSGKTHTISGLIRPMADFIARHSLWQSKSLKIYLTMFEILGNVCTDLLDPEAAKGGVDVLEDHLGQIRVKGSLEVEVQTVQDLVDLTLEAFFQNRRTASTFKNDQSSRSHAICQLRIENGRIQTAEDGVVFLVDLAGSEHGSDTVFHGTEQIEESKAINATLMALKECARNRALSCQNPSKFYHVPYRQSKLTLLLKDALELTVKKASRTVVLANLSPSCADLKASVSTLKFASSIRIGNNQKLKLEPNPRNPAEWTHEQLAAWVRRTAKGKVDPEKLCPFETGRQMFKLPETLFVQRVLDDPSNAWTEKKAKAFYSDLWELLIVARTAERRKKMKRQRLVADHVYGKASC